jgi:hypothetical protein
MWVRACAVIWDGSVEDLPTAGYLIKSISGIYIEIVDFMASFGCVGSLPMPFTIPENARRPRGSFPCYCLWLRLRRLRFFPKQSTADSAEDADEQQDSVFFVATSVSEWIWNRPSARWRSQQLPSQGFFPSGEKRVLRMGLYRPG